MVLVAQQMTYFEDSQVLFLDLARQLCSVVAAVPSPSILNCAHLRVRTNDHLSRDDVCSFACVRVCEG